MTAVQNQDDYVTVCVGEDEYAWAYETLTTVGRHPRQRDGAYHVLITMWWERRLTDEQVDRTAKFFRDARVACDLRPNVAERLNKYAPDLREQMWLS